MTKQIYFADTHAGSGKSYSAHQFLKHYNGLATIATQTNDLSEQHHADLAKIGVRSHVISGRNTANCTKSYADLCRRKSKSIGIINQNVALTPISDASERLLILDEIPSPVQKFVVFEEPTKWRSDMSRLFEGAIETDIDGYLQLTINERLKELADLGSSLKSSIKQEYIDIAKRVCNPHYRVYVQATNYESYTSKVTKILDDESQEERELRTSLTVYAWLQPSVFTHLKQQPIILGFNFLKSKLALYWASLGVQFVEHPSIKGERYSDFSHKADHITIRHMRDDDVSMSWLEKIGYQDAADSLADVIEAQYPEQDYLICLSKRNPYEWKGQRGEIISPNPLGLNCYQHMHMAVHFAPLNPSAADLRAWKAVCGVTEQQYQVSQSYELQYQMVTRTAVRDGKAGSSKPLVFIVLDLRSANYLRQVFGITKPSIKLDVPALEGWTKPERKKHKPHKPHKTRCDKLSPEDKKAANRAKTAAYRARKRAEAAAAMTA